MTCLRLECIANAGSERCQADRFPYGESCGESFGDRPAAVVATSTNALGIGAINCPDC